MASHEGRRRRWTIAIPGLVVAFLVLASLPVHWHKLFHRIDWGSAPAWVGAIALVTIALACRQIARHLTTRDSATNQRV
jgi:hypothetical protein